MDSYRIKWDAMNRIEQAYDGMPEYEWHRLERHPAEHGLTLRAMRDHLPKPPAGIIDIGGGVGRYAIELARRGYGVTLVDISAKSLDFARQKAAEAGVELSGYVKADARDLSAFDDKSFDAVLLMGPLYHLLEHAERLVAVREARRLLRDGGVILAAFITPTIVVQSALAVDIEYIQRDRQELDSILTSGLFRPPVVRNFPDAWFSRPAEVDPLMAEGGFAQRALLNCEVLAFQLEANLLTTRPEVREQWLDLLYRFAGDATMTGTGGHMLYAGTKVGGPAELPTLATGRLVLRPFEPADAPRVQQLAGAREVADTTLNMPHPYPDGAAETWVSRHRREFLDGRGLTLAITLAGGPLIGAVSLMDISRRHRHAEIGYWIGKDYWGCSGPAACAWGSLRGISDL